MSFGASATELGLASYYGAAGLTAAHRSLPMGSSVKVVNLDNGRSAVLRISDRGPFIRGRIIDVSTVAAEALGFRSAGLAHVRVEVVARETRAYGPRPEPQPATLQTASYEIGPFGAQRLQDGLRGEAAAMRSEAEYENSRVRLTGPPGRPEVLASLAAGGGAFPTGAEAAIAIPVSAIAEAEAASIPVAALPPVPASHTSPNEKLRRLSAMSFVAPLFTRLRHILD